MVAASCLHYGGSLVTLSGKVQLQTFFGPPNYGENPATDSREIQAILLLEKPICVEANPKDYDEAEQNQGVVTLVPLGNENLKGYEGKNNHGSGYVVPCIQRASSHAGFNRNQTH